MDCRELTTDDKTNSQPQKAQNDFGRSLEIAFVFLCLFVAEQFGGFRDRFSR
jgi:hypothetical protein